MTHQEPSRSSFRDWSRQAATKRTIWPTRPKLPAATMSVLLTPPPRFVRYPVNFEVGEPHASIGIDSADIRFPQPFDQDGLSDVCRDFIIESVGKAVEQDGHLRWIIWPDRPTTSCNRIGRRSKASASMIS